MGTQPTTRYRVDVVCGILQECFISEPLKRQLHDKYERYKRESALVTTEALVAGVKLPRFNDNLCT